jgi:hypothetical protein
LAQRLEKTGQRVAVISRALANTLAQAGGQELPGRLVRGAKQLISMSAPRLAPPQPFTGRGRLTPPQVIRTFTVVGVSAAHQQQGHRKSG